MKLCIDALPWNNGRHVYLVSPDDMPKWETDVDLCMHAMAGVLDEERVEESSATAIARPRGDCPVNER